ncbi:MAG: methyltransferase domain-containing protein [Polyangiales bacterium]
MSSGESDQAFEAALAYDGAVVPRYARPFGERLLDALRFDALRPGARPEVLDLACRTGYPAARVLAKAGEGRVIALDRDAKFLELARARLGADAGRRVFFKQSPAAPLRFGDEVFTHAYCNLVDRVTVDRAGALAELARVLVPHGQVVLTLPARGSFAEAMDLLRESAVRHDLPRLLERVDQYDLALPTPEGLADELAGAGFVNAAVDTFAFTLDYGSSQELFADPVIAHAALPDWRWCAEAAPDADAVLAAVRHALDAYYAGGRIPVSVVGAVASGWRG